MTIPKVAFSVIDNGLGQQNPGTGNTVVVVGVGSGGSLPVNTPLDSATAGAFVAAGGYGPGPQLAELILSQSGNNVIFVPASSTTPGSNTSVYSATGNTSTSAVTVTGTPNDTYYVTVQPVTGGVVGTGPIQLNVSLDAGRSVYKTVNLGTANSYVIPNTGLTLNFGAGSLATSDTFYFVSSEPQASNASVTSAIQSLYGLPFGEQPVVIYDAGCHATGSDVTAYDADMTALFNKKRFMRMFTAAQDCLWGGTSTQTENAWIATIEASHVNDSSTRVGVSAGHYNVQSPVDQVQYRRPLSWLAAIRNSENAIQIDLGRVSDGALAPVSLPSVPTWPPAILSPVFGGTGDGFLYHNEAANPGLDAARFMTALTYVGLPGFYITDPQLMAPPGSDFNELEHGLVIDAACLVWYLFATQQLRSGVRVNKTTGFIFETDRQQIQMAGTQALRNILTPGNVVTDVYVTISATDPILSTSTLNATVSVIPLGLIEVINTVVQFQNPALQAV
jgi:hypothetical protein